MAVPVQYNVPMHTPPPNGLHGKSHIDLLLDFLRGEGMGHDWRVRLLLKYGHAFEASPLPDDVSVMQERCCYLNSYTLAVDQPERFTYFEGYASTLRGNGWGTAHAWCIDRQRRVADPTWANFASDRPGAYLGLAIPLAVVKPYATVESRGTFHGWLCERREEMETELPRLLGVDPI